MTSLSSPLACRAFPNRQPAGVCSAGARTAAAERAAPPDRTPSPDSCPRAARAEGGGRSAARQRRPRTLERPSGPGSRRTSANATARAHTGWPSARSSLVPGQRRQRGTRKPACSLCVACTQRHSTRQQQASKPRQRSKWGRAWPSRLEVVLQRLQGRRNQVVRGAWAVWLQQATTG